ncbi:MAG: right-handed parallel beta-helix repeat-containing protein, partial [Candidatus Aenigmatarchaeota archaeon]
MKDKKIKRGRIFLKKISILLFFLLVVFCGMMLSKKVRGQSQQVVKTVCPSGVAGQNGCDYIGGDGIQKAVDEALQGNSSNKTRFIIKSGVYTRQNYTEYITAHNKKIKCFVNTKEKFLIFEGEKGAVLDGANSSNMSGFCAKGGEIEIKGLIIKGFKKDNKSCFSQNSTACSRGYGIQLEGNVKAIITNNQISKNEDVGIILFDNSQANISNNQITENRDRGINVNQDAKVIITSNQISKNEGFGIILFDNSQANISNNQITENRNSGIDLTDNSKATIINNTISYNKVAGIDIYQCDSNNPSVIVKNNIITHTKKNTDNTFGFGIGGGCLHSSNRLANDHFSYNLIFANEGENTSCGNEELCENFEGRINADPQFVNHQNGDFRLKSTSPAINSGDPSITDADGSRSDMGAWGGPNPLPLVLNGDFEQGWFGWEKNGKGIQEIIKIEGKGYVLHEKNEEAGSRVIQWVPIQNGRFYKLELELKGQGNVGGGPLAKADEWCLGGKNGNTYIKGKQFTLNQNWNKQNWIFQAGNCQSDQDHRLAIFFDTNNNHKGEIWVDNIELTPINPYRRKHYSAIIIGEKSLAVDYSYSDGNRVAAFLNKGHSLESADTTIFLPRVLKGAYKKNDNDPGFNSGIVIMNTENEQANVTLKIYKKDGSRLLKEYNFTLPPFGFKGIWPPSYADWPIEETDPPAVITSNKKVVVSVDLRHDNLDPQNTANIEGSLRGSAYEGIPQKYTSTTWYIPIIVRNAYNEGWESGIIIQNTEDQQANLSISLYGIDNDYQKTCSNILLPPKSQRIIYFPSSSYCECFTELISNSNYNNNKKFSAKISSNKKIAVVFSHSSSSKRKSIEENAIPQELIDSKIFIPRVYNNYSGWISSFTIQNTSNLQNNNIKIKYIKNNGVSEEGSGSCFLNQIFPLKSIVVFAPNCIGEGNFYSAVIESTNNLPLAGIYYLDYPKNPPSPENLNVYRSAGSTAFSQKETSRVFFIPRIYFYSWNWQTGLQIQNAVDENNQFDLYILSENGKILVEKRNISLSAYQAKSYYLPNDFSFELAQEPPEGNYPSLPSISPTPTPTPTHTPTPASTLTPACAKKTLGDANCDGNIDENDYNIWKCEFLGNGRCNNPSSNLSASFNLDEKVDLIDFDIWRKNRFVPTPTFTNTPPTNTPAPPGATNTPTPTNLPTCGN